jgi:hypothetical protein
MPPLCVPRLTCQSLTQSSEEARNPGSRSGKARPSARFAPSDIRASTKLRVSRRIAENALSKNICFVAHVGAVVEHNNHDVVEHNNHQEWSIAQRAFSLIPVPFANAPGNYDFRPDGTASTRDTLLHSYLREEIGHPVVS